MGRHRRDRAILKCGVRWEEKDPGRLADIRRSLSGFRDHHLKAVLHLDTGIARIDGQLAKTKGAIDRYFEACEAGTLKAELWNEKVSGLQTREQEMEAEKQGLEARGKRLELPAIDREMLASIADNIERMMAESENPKKEAPSPPNGEEGAYPQSRYRRDLVLLTEFSTIREQEHSAPQMCQYANPPRMDRT